MFKERWLAVFTHFLCSSWQLRHSGVLKPPRPAERQLKGPMLCSRLREESQNTDERWGWSNPILIELCHWNLFSFFFLLHCRWKSPYQLVEWNAKYIRDSTNREVDNTFSSSIGQGNCSTYLRLRFLLSPTDEINSLLRSLSVHMAQALSSIPLGQLWWNLGEWSA